MTVTTHTARLLPWSTPEGKPCYLSSDGSGYLARVADNIESVQLGMAGDLLDHVAELLNDGKATADQLRFTLACMSQALRDTKRIADSRGSRLPVPDGDPGLVDVEGDDRDDGPQLPAEAFG
ncbi:hypothetical protein AB0H77_17940 [Streptomyces sp. NPDC050844]|uniref:hypothetical protein n=1 Tax=Streptomyces sp. NPDC050844 TaxID=3155790 RepID=UPI0033E1FA82